MQVVLVLIGYFIDGAENQPFICAERRLFLEYDDCAYYEQQEERYLPDEFFLVHIYFVSF
jgi:hypothetical protein